MSGRYFTEEQLETLRRLQGELRAKGLELTLEQVQSARLTQADMAIEGWDSPLEEVARTLAEHWASGDEEIIPELVRKAKEEGRSYLEVIEEHFDSPKGPNS